MKTKIIAHIHYSKWHWEDKGEYQIFPCKLEDDKQRCYVGQQEIEIDVPHYFDHRPQQIAALEKEKQKIMADYQKTVTDINDRINNLKAITV